MRTLIVATSTTPPDIQEKIRSGYHHRIDYLELARRIGGDVVDYNIVPVNRPIRLLEEWLRMDFRQALQIAQKVRREGYDQVFSMSERVGIPLALILGKNVRHVVQVAHSLSKYKLILIRLLGIPHRWNVMILPTNAEAAKLDKALNHRTGKMEVLHYPVDTLFYRPQDESDHSLNPPHFESLGLSYRDYPTLIHAMRGLPEVTGYLRAGSTWVNHSAGYEHETLPPNIQLKPFVDPCELRWAYWNSQFIVVPIKNTTQWSAGCTSVSQAQAMGVPVIATCTPGLQEYMKDEVTGLLVKAGDPAALSRAILRLWENPEEAKKMGQNARQFCQDNLSLDDWVERVAGLLGEN